MRAARSLLQQLDSKAHQRSVPPSILTEIGQAVDDSNIEALSTALAILRQHLYNKIASQWHIFRTSLHFERYQRSALQRQASKSNINIHVSLIGAQNLQSFDDIASADDFIPYCNFTLAPSDSATMLQQQVNEPSERIQETVGHSTPSPTLQQKETVFPVLTSESAEGGNPQWNPNVAYTFKVSASEMCHLELHVFVMDKREVGKLYGFTNIPLSLLLAQNQRQAQDETVNRGTSTGSQKLRTSPLVIDSELWLSKQHKTRMRGVLTLRLVADSSHLTVSSTMSDSAIRISETDAKGIRTPIESGVSHRSTGSLLRRTNKKTGVSYSTAASHVTISQHRVSKSQFVRAGQDHMPTAATGCTPFVGRHTMLDFQANLEHVLRCDADMADFKSQTKLRASVSPLKISKSLDGVARTDSAERQELSYSQLQYLTRYVQGCYDERRVKLWKRLADMERMASSVVSSIARDSQRIQDQFILPGSQNEVNISQKSKLRWRQAQRKRNVDAILDATRRAVHEVTVMIQRDSFLRFKKSALWRECKRAVVFESLRSKQDFKLHVEVIGTTGMDPAEDKPLQDLYCKLWVMKNAVQNQPSAAPACRRSKSPKSVSRPRSRIVPRPRRHSASSTFVESTPSTQASVTKSGGISDLVSPWSTGGRYRNGVYTGSTSPSRVTDFGNNSDSDTVSPTDPLKLTTPQSPLTDTFVTVRRSDLRHTARQRCGRMAATPPARAAAHAGVFHFSRLDSAFARPRGMLERKDHKIRRPVGAHRIKRTGVTKQVRDAVWAERFMFKSVNFSDSLVFSVHAARRKRRPRLGRSAALGRAEINLSVLVSEPFLERKLPLLCVDDPSDSGFDVTAGSVGTLTVRLALEPQAVRRILSQLTATT